MENTEIELDGQRSPEAQAIIDAELGENQEVEPEDDVELPSDEGQEEEVLLAGKYKDSDALKKGIVNIGSNLPEYVLNGMSDEALEQHYNELQKTIPTEQRGRKHASKPEEEKLDKTPEDVKDTGVSDELWTELDAEFSTTGAISSEQYDKLNKVGIPDSVIDKYIDGIKAEADLAQQQFTQGVYKIAGGEEQYHAIKSWAEDGGIPSERLAEISAMKDYKDITLAMYEIKAQYDMNANKPSNTVRGANGAKSGGNKYQSEAEYISDVRDPKYRTDARFREKVKAKYDRSGLTS